MSASFNKKYGEEEISFGMKLNEPGYCTFLFRGYYYNNTAELFLVLNPLIGDYYWQQFMDHYSEFVKYVMIDDQINKIGLETNEESIEEKIK